ncbi:hypothetical protein B0H14DRAFT_3460110 [Mycena olivaceomarginata]|nr:hypothetical protein B0H14DRAFT_3460110 [Mycena olivaceomarginata]
MAQASQILPPGHLFGHYSNKNELYTVHWGSPDVVRQTPSPLQAPPINHEVRIPLFRELRYLSLEYPYLLFIPKRYPWHSPLFHDFHRLRYRIPIVSNKEGFALAPDLANTWTETEQCLRGLGQELFRLLPNSRWLQRINPWFFPGRFKFLRRFPSEKQARFAVWLSMENFLPLLGYVAMGLWLITVEKQLAIDRGEDPLDWRAQVIKNTGIHASYLEYAEEAISWGDERVGAIYRVESPQNLTPEEREQRFDIEHMLSSIMHSPSPIPIYLSWGKIPQFMTMNMLDVPEPFQDIAPGPRVLKSLYVPYADDPGAGKLFLQDSLRFSKWAVDTETCEWYQDPFAPLASTAPPPPASKPTSAAPIARHDKPSAPAVPATPFPPLPLNSQQKKGETIQVFFIRRSKGNRDKMTKESSADRQRRTSRAEHAQKGGVPSKATVFLWEKVDEHYIRQPQLRGEFTDLWGEYPGPQRRFDPFHNQWDLCELFASNDPVFGEGFAQAPDSDDEIDPADATFPQNIDMASQLAPMDTSRDVDMHEEHPRNAVQEQEHANFAHRRAFEFPYSDYVHGEVQFDADITESELPKGDLATASKNCVSLIFLKFGMAPRTEEPEYEPVAANLLDALYKRFGFTMPPSPDRFDVRDPSEECLEPKHLANVIGMTDIANQLASDKALQNILCTFLGSPQRPKGAPMGFTINREYLTSMRNPAERMYYYVLAEDGSGIGSEVLLLPHATDLLEVLRQRWGPDIKGIIKHLLARGIPFWLAYRSLQIMPESTPAPAGLRPKGFKADTTSGLGFRPHGYKFDQHDYRAYTTRRDFQLLHTPRGRIALQYGGVVARLARSEVSDDDFFRGFDDEIYDTMRSILLCGVYHVGTGQKKGKGREKADTDTDQASIVSWWPKPNAWARGNLDGSWWTPQCENDFFAKRLGHLANGVFVLPRQSQWRSNLKFRKEVKKCWDGVEIVSDSIVQGLVARCAAST